MAKVKAKQTIRGPSERYVSVRGRVVRVRTIAALASACNVSRLTIKRQWERACVLPRPTLTGRVRWYSDSYIETVATVVTVYRATTPRGKRSLADLKIILRAAFKLSDIR